eukprot:CAMPEP_0203923392 /NCGR_PEP_ID=MMETSP0359-20131031/63314_1 /ASSEMBLY_ACC=CAM_ASM_000338 /TAXON_ID=268821 /ORGANISM="Scrippsiella Hangoei, Strain SHTV-5" /LENGTH=78 /DNA_ID=CAMNT_0050851467 /DNA_START=112 /DNA_END=346 /DNA_ORIENTATION=-
MAPSRMSAPISEVRPSAQQRVVWRRQKCGRKPCRAWGNNEEVARVAGDRDGGSSGGAAEPSGVERTSDQRHEPNTLPE